MTKVYIEATMTPNRMTNCPFCGGIKKIFLLATSLLLLVTISVLDWSNYDRKVGYIQRKTFSMTEVRLRFHIIWRSLIQGGPSPYRLG